jgi:hypothetical protein
MVPAAGDKLFANVLVDPCSPPREIMIGWYDGSWEHRAYWGEDLLPYNTPGTGRIRFGDIPAGGEWGPARDSGIDLRAGMKIDSRPVAFRIRWSCVVRSHREPLLRERDRAAP